MTQQATSQLTLVSHHLCPYVQRAVIALHEKGIGFERRDIDLSNKPDWFLNISPLGKTPVLLAGGTAIFESAVILEYLEETQPNPLHPVNPLQRAEHRSWMEFGSSVLNDIAGLYSAPDQDSFASKIKLLTGKFGQLEGRIIQAPHFDGHAFSLVDAVFAPIFRYFDIFDEIGNFDVFTDAPKVLAWRKILKHRPSVITAVAQDYPVRLREFLLRRNSHLSTMMKAL